MKKTLNAIDQYIAGFPEHVRELLEQMRATIHKAVPEAEEVISYGMPAFKLKAVLVYFAGYKHHIGFYPTSSGIREFQKDFEGYKSSKGAVQFPVDKPLPLDLVARIAKFRADETKEKAQAKKKAKPEGSFLTSLAAPARRALESIGVKAIEDLTKFSESEILALHGMGPSTIPKLQAALQAAGLGFKK